VGWGLGWGVLGGFSFGMVYKLGVEKILPRPVFDNAAFVTIVNLLATEQVLRPLLQR